MGRSRLVAGLALALAALAPLASRAAPPPGGSGQRAYPDPSSVIAAELAFNRLAREKGQWTAFRETAAPQAEMFVPQRVSALVWLKGRPDPSPGLKWQPHAVWLSCDGRTAATRGGWQRPDGKGGEVHGWFVTVWQRQPKHGTWKWVMDQGDALPAPLPEPELIAGTIADCSTGRPVALPPLVVPQGHDARGDAAADSSLAWVTAVAPDGARTLALRMWNGTAFDTVLDLKVAAAGG